MSIYALKSMIRPHLTNRLPLSAVRKYSGRTMSTNSQKKEWLAILPDKPNVLEIRKKVKGDHYEEIKPLIASGKLPAAGAIFEKHPVEGKPALFKGSAVVYAAESIEQVYEIIQNDVYAKSGVWDLQNVQIFPYVPAIREPLPK